MDILFWIHRSKKNKKGLAPLRLRITLGPGDRSEWSTKKYIEPELWSVGRKRVLGTSVQASIINKLIVSNENKLNKIESDLLANDMPCNSEIIRNIFFGTHIQRYSLIQVLDMHNDLFSQKIGQNGFSPDTLKKYTGLRVKLEYFLKLKYNRSEIFISELTLDFIESFWHFLVTKGKQVNGIYAQPMDPESACGIIKRLKKVSKMGFRKQGIYINPFEDFKETFSKEGKHPLTMDEVNTIMTKELGNMSLDRVRDRLIVGCFTGMANSDIQAVTRDMISTDISGQKWIDMGRTKTGELCIIPLWEPVLRIIEKYGNDPIVKSGNKLFPQISLQKMNAYLKIIAAACDINRNITTHVLRHTFADIYLNSGGTIENLARILGHSTTRTTSIYAKRNKKTISDESNRVKDNIFGHIRQINERKIS